MATEDRWHDFSKEKPSEDMEGRNFIVSNGHYEKIATWCGYWENEPFMGDRLCDEVVRWKGYLTPEEEKANEETRTEPTLMKCDELKEKIQITNDPRMVYLKSEVDAAIAELKQAIHDAEMAKDDAEAANTEYREDIKQLNAKNEKLKTWMKEHFYCDEMLVVEKREHKATRRALWLARANSALEKIAWFKLWNCSISTMNPEDGARQEYDKWKKNLGKFLKKAEQYK